MAPAGRAAKSAWEIAPRDCRPVDLARWSDWVDITRDAFGAALVMAAAIMACMDGR